MLVGGHYWDLLSDLSALADVQNEIKEIHQRIDDFLADTLSPGQVAGFAKIVSYKFVIEADPIVALLKRGVSKTMFLEIESQDAGDGGSVAWLVAILTGSKRAHNQWTDMTDDVKTIRHTCSNKSKAKQITREVK